MAFKFDDAYNKFAKSATSLNRGVNKMIGKDVFKDVNEIEPEREFAPYDSFPEYTVPEPEQWSPFQGEKKIFTLEDNTISISENLDACMKYRSVFKTSAQYYKEKFIYKYKNCVQDFDSFVHYFSELYLDGLMPMINRAYSVLLPFGVFNADIENFTSQHVSTYKKAINSYEIVAGVEASKNQAAANLGDKVGGAVHMRGGGFGLKGAMKGVAKAEAFNIGMGLVGKYVALQNKMTQEEKAEAFALFKEEVFFEEVYSDYYNTFLTMVQSLINNNLLGNIKTVTDAEFDNMIRNIQNPMFPQDKVVSALVTLISTYPYEVRCFELLQQKFGQTDEVNQIIAYFVE